MNRTQNGADEIAQQKRGRGRPTTHDEATARRYVGFAVAVPLKSNLEEAAKDNRRSLAAEAISRLEASFQPPRRVELQRALKERLTGIERRLGRIELFLEYLVGKVGVVMTDLPPFLREDEICRDTKVGYAGILPMSQGAFRSAVKIGRIPKPDIIDGIQVWRREDILKFVGLEPSP